ncbi:MAG: pentapeptide repeat-containing protein [Halobacteriota archaeon]
MRTLLHNRAEARLTMANQSHVQMLRQGVSVWNQWRAAHPEIRPDLSGAYLTGVDLTQADLIKADLRGTDLTQAGLHPG